MAGLFVVFVSDGIVDVNCFARPLRASGGICLKLLFALGRGKSSPAMSGSNESWGEMGLDDDSLLCQSLLWLLSVRERRSMSLRCGCLLHVVHIIGAMYSSLGLSAFE